MNIAIIGCGYVGKATARFWNSAHHTIAVTTRSSLRREELQEVAHRVTVTQGNDIEKLSELLTNQQAVLLSIGADSHLPEEYEKAYLHTARTLSKALENNSSVHQVIYTGSTSVYGDHAGAWVSETTPLSADSIYGKILSETEKVLLTMAKKTCSVCILRLGEIYGPGREIADRLKRYQGKPLPGSGENFTNRVHLDDIVRGLDFALTHKLHGIYNLCEDQHPKRQELYNTVCEKEGLPKPVWDSQTKNFYSGNKRVSNQKIKAAGYTFSH